MKQRNILLSLLLIFIIGIIVLLEYQKPRVETVAIHSDPNSMDLEMKAKMYEPAKEITTPDGFVNIESISLNELIGKKAVLIDFWTYSCINCQRTFPYLNAWYDKYRDQGLEIIGIHTPEFKFEHDYNNVLEAVDRFGIKHPVVLDNDFSTWRAYRNRFWPRKYLIDIDGYIVYDHIGEGGYEETESKIQELLEERRQKLGENIQISGGKVDPNNTERVDPLKRRSPETYFGALRNENFGNGVASKVGVQNLTVPQELAPSLMYLDGAWQINGEFSENLEPGAKIIFRYQAQKVFMVASSAESARAKILVDGQPLDENNIGQHVRQEAGESILEVQNEQLYRLVEDQEFGEHTLEIIIKEPGFKAFTFTFG